jgi:Xaa-Pro aminopeptidase
MVLAIDVPLRASGIGALSFGDTGVVTDHGFEPMTEPDRGLVRLPS